MGSPERPGVTPGTAELNQTENSNYRSDFAVPAFLYYKLSISHSPYPLATGDTLNVKMVESLLGLRGI